MDRLSSFIPTIRSGAIPPHVGRYNPFIGRIAFAALFLLGAGIATAAWFALRNRTIQPQPPIQQPVPDELSGQQSDAQRLADMVSPDRSPSEEARNLASTLLGRCPEKTDSRWDIPEHILQDGVMLYHHCGEVEDVRSALTLIANGKPLNSDHQVEYIRNFDRLMIKLKTTAAKIRKEKERGQEVYKKIDDFIGKWRDDLMPELINELCEILRRIKTAQTLEERQEFGKKLNGFLDSSPNYQSLSEGTIKNELKEIMINFQTAPETSGAE